MSDTKQIVSTEINNQSRHSGKIDKSIIQVEVKFQKRQKVNLQYRILQQ